MPWLTLTLAGQFTLMSAALVLIGLGVLGFWVSHKIQEGVRMHMAGQLSHYAQELAPLLRDIPAIGRLSDAAAEELDEMLAKDAHRMRIAAVKIWTRDGTILYATDKDLIGRQFAVSPRLKSAWEGRVEVEFSEEPHSDHASPVGRGPFLEIYVPVHDAATGQIFAVAELYEDETYLEERLFKVKIESWIATALISLSIVCVLFMVVFRGSQTIEVQHSSLADRISRLSELLRQNEDLKQRVRLASQRRAEGAELHLSRLGTDLHDGPAQLLALGLLKLDQVLDRSKTSLEERDMVRGVLAEAMAEIRDISGGLALPGIKEMCLADALRFVISGHEKRTSTAVSCRLSGSPIELSHPIKLCLCRFVQEGLNNAFRHANGVGQTVAATWTDKLIVIKVSDQGPGFDPTLPRETLGLIGLQSRLESLGGYMTVQSQPGSGTTLTAYLSVNG